MWDGHDLERGHTGPPAVPERVDLGGAVAAMCIAETGAAPVRPHMVAINAGQSHAIISFVASGHVVFLDADVTSPNGSHVFTSLRGPVPLTADPHVSTGSTPGVGVSRSVPVAAPVTSSRSPP